MKTTNLILALSTVLVLSGCATAYQSNGLGGGYTDTALAPDLYRIVFRGNLYTTPERTQDLALLRASELTVQHGFSCFAIIDEQNSPSIRTYTTPGHMDTTTSIKGDFSGFSFLDNTFTAQGKSRTTYTPPQTHTSSMPRIGILVKAFEKKPDGIFTFDAAFLQQTLKEKYRIK